MTDTTVRDITITREFDAPRELVFDAWTKREHFTHWWGPEGFSAPIASIEIDARPGGRWQADMVADDGSGEHPFFGVYHEVQRPERLSFSLVDPNDPDFEDRQARGDADDVTTVVLSENDGRTVMTFHQKAQLPPEEIERATEGWNSFFNCLATYVAGKS